MQTTTLLFRRHRKNYLLTGIFLLMVGWLQAQGTYYSRPAATDFTAAASWTTDPAGVIVAPPASVSNADNFVIQNGSIMTLPSSVSVRNLTINAGALTVASNTLTVSLATGNTAALLVNANGFLNASGGNITINGRLAVASAGRLDQSAGIIRVDGNNNGTALTSVASGTPLVLFSTNLVTNLNLTGGTLLIVDPHVQTAVTATNSFSYSGTVHIALGINHTVQFGDPTSTDATANAAGFRQETCTGSNRLRYGKLIINTTGSGNRLLVTQQYTTQPVSVESNMTITSGDYRNSGVLCVGGSLLNSGTLTTTGTLYLGTSTGGYTVGTGLVYGTTNSVQTINGAGVFRNTTSNATSTANYANITFANTNAGTGVTFSNLNSLLCTTGGPTNIGTTSGTSTFTSGNISTSSNRYIQGVSAAAPGIFTWTSGGFTSGSIFRRWLGTGTLTTSATAVTTAFPFVNAGNSRHVLMNQSAALTTGGWIEVTHNHATGTVGSVFADGAYNVDLRTNAGWAFSTGGSINLGASTLALGLSGDGVVSVLTLGNAPRLIRAATAVGVHQPGSGTTSAPIANRTGLVLADITTQTYYIGLASADIGFYSVTTGNWNTPGTWSKSAVPTSADNPIVSAGDVVTVNSAAAALSVQVNGTLDVSANTLSVTGASGSAISVAGGGVLTVSGGTVNIGPQDNSFCDRTLTLANNATLNVSSGTLNLAGNLATTAGFIFNQSGGNINVDPNANGVAGNSTASVVFNLNVTNATSINWTGGTLTFVDPPISTANTITLTGSFVGSETVTNGHTIRFGDGVSSTSGGTSGWNLNTWATAGGSGMHFGNAVFNGPSGTNRFVTSVYQQPVRGNVTINTGGESRIGSLFIGGNLVNDGTLTSTTLLGFFDATMNGGSLIFADATSAQSINGTGTFRNALAPTANLSGIRIQNSSVSGVTLGLPLNMNGSLTMANGKFNTTSTNILTLIKTAVANNVFIGTGTAGYITGPFRTTVPASFTNATMFFPVGKTAPDWFALFNVITNAGGSVTFQVEKNNSIGAPSTYDGSLIGLTAGHEWVTSIVSGASNLTSFNAQANSSAIAAGNVLAGIQSPATDFSVFGTGSTITVAGAPLFSSMAQNNPSSNGTEFPDRFAIGQTGALNVFSVTLAQNTVPAVPIVTTSNTTNNNLARAIIAVVGLTGTAALDQITFNYTGTAPASDITSVTLWTGTFTAPVALAGTSTINGLNQIIFSGLNSNLVGGANYYWVRFNVSPTAGIGNTVDVSLPIGGANGWILTGGATAAGTYPSVLQNPTGSVLIDYCLPTYTYACTGNDVLTAFSLSTLSSTPGCPGALPNNYAFNAATVSLQQGSAYTANFTTGSGGSQGVAIYFDFNRDGDFADAGEFFATTATVAASSAGSLNVTIDPAAVLGAGCRMRVLNRYITNPVVGDVCSPSLLWGSVVDYNITITTPTPRSLSSITAVQQTGGMGASSTNNNLLRVDIATANSFGTLTLSQARFTYTGTSSADIAASGVSLWTGTSTAPSAQIGTSQSIAGGLVNFTGLSVNLNQATNYLWLRVNTSAGAVINNIVDAKIAIGDLTITAAGGAIAPVGSQPAADVDPAGNRFIDYCTPLYSTGCSASDRITSFGINTLLNASGAACSTSPAGYVAYAPAGALTTSLQQGSSYTATISIGTGGAAGVAIWIDFNNNGVFDAAEKFATPATIASGGTGTITVNVPVSATLGNLRLRARLVWNSAGTAIDACNNYTYGETEDYTITMVAPPNCSTLLPFPATVATASSVSVCAGDFVNFGITVPMPSGLGITYQWLRNGSPFGVVQNSANVSLPVTLSGNYSVEVRCNSVAQVTSTAIAITANNPQVLGVTNGTRCGVGSVNLNATCSVGAQLRYYDALTGGNLLATRNSGVLYATNPLPNSSTTNFYVEAAVVAGSGTSGPVSPSIGTFGGFSGSFYQQFNTSIPVKIISVDIYPTQAGTAVIELRNNLGVIVNSYSQTVTAGQANSTITSIGTPLTVPVNFTVPAGTGWQLNYVSSGPICIRNSAGSSSYYNTPISGVTHTGNWFADNNYWYNMYNWQIEQSCTSARSLVTATVTTAPAITSDPLTSIAICEGDNVTLQASSTNLTYVYTWTPGGAGSSITVNPSITTSYTVNGVTSLGCTNTRNITVQVNPKPAPPTSVSSNPAPVFPATIAEFCPNLTTGSFTPLTINATGTFSFVNTIFLEDFTSGAGSGWQTAYVQNNGSEVHGPLSRWTFPSAPYTYPGTSQTFNSTGSFAASFSDDQDPLSTFTTTGAVATLTSPINAINVSPSITALELKYDVSFRAVTLDVFKVQYSTDNFLTSTDVPLSTLGTSVNTPTTLGNFATQTLALPLSLAGATNLRIRFYYESDWGWWVAVDNVEIKETTNSPQFSFSPAAGLYFNLAASSPYVANTPVTQVYAAPFSNSIYSVSVRNPSTGCISNPVTLPINVCSVVTDQICNAATVTVLDAPPANLASVVNKTNIGAPITGSLAGLCTPLKSDVWYKAVIPASGDIHVYTFAANTGNPLFELDSTVVAIYSSSDGTCTGTLTQLGCDAYNGVDGHTYVSASGLTPGSNVFIRVGSRQANIDPPVGLFKLVVLSGLYWTGTAGDFTFTNASNWYGADGTTTGILPSISKSIIIPQSATNNYPYVIGNQDIHGINFYFNTLTANTPMITIDPAAKLRINSSLQRGGFLTAKGNPFILSNPRVAGSGVLEFINTNVNPLFNIHNINTPSSSNQIIIEGVLGVKTNAQLNSNGRLSFINNAVLLSGGVKTGNVAYNYGGTVNGSIIYRRSGTEYGKYDYWSSPISNGNTTSLSTSYGSNLYTYNNTASGASSNVQLGWGTPLAASTPMQIGRGYIQTYAGNGTVVFNGLPNQVSFDYTPTLSLPNRFNLIGNPFPSSLKINEFRARGTNAGTLGSIYLWNQSGFGVTSTGDYVVINSSNVAAGGTPPSGYSVSNLELGACQAFMTDVQNTNDITFSSEDRVPTYPVNSTQFFSTSSDISLVRLDLRNSSGIALNTVVAFSETSSDQFVGGEDSPRLPGSTGFDIYSKLDNQDLVIQMFSPLLATRVVDLGTSISINGAYTISMSEYVNFDPSTRVFLEDRANGTFQGLNSNPNYTFTTDPSFQGVRFRLHFMAPVNMASSSTCVGETNGKLIVSNSNMAYPMTAVLKNNNGETVSNSGQFVGEHIFQNLSSGNYTVDMSYVDGSVFSLSSNVGVSGVLSPASFIASSNSVQLADAIIEFAATAPGATEFIWNFGDGTIETTSATPVHAYMQPGIYTVTLTALSGGCSSTATSVITVTDNTTGIANVGNSKGFSIYPNPANDAAKLLLNVDLKDAQATISITDAAGRLVNKHNLTNLRSGAIVDLDINGLANGVYEVSIDSKNFRSVGRLTIAK